MANGAYTQQDCEQKPYGIPRLVALPLPHPFAGPLVHVAALRCGTPTYLLSRFSVPAYVDAIRAYQITDIPVVPSMLVDLASLACNQPAVLPSLREVVSAGASLTTSVATRFKPLLPARARLIQVYGLTEVGWIASTPWTSSSASDGSNPGKRNYRSQHHTYSCQIPSPRSSPDSPPSSPLPLPLPPRPLAPSPQATPPFPSPLASSSSTHAPPHQSPPPTPQASSSCTPHTPSFIISHNTRPPPPPPSPPTGPDAGCAPAILPPSTMTPAAPAAAPPTPTPSRPAQGCHQGDRRLAGGAGGAGEGAAGASARRRCRGRGGAGWEPRKGGAGCVGGAADTGGGGSGRRRRSGGGTGREGGGGGAEKGVDAVGWGAGSAVQGACRGAVGGADIKERRGEGAEGGSEGEGTERERVGEWRVWEGLEKIV